MQSLVEFRFRTAFIWIHIWKRSSLKYFLNDDYGPSYFTRRMGPKILTSNIGIWVGMRPHNQDSCHSGTLPTSVHRSKTSPFIGYSLTDHCSSLSKKLLFIWRYHRVHGEGIQMFDLWTAIKQSSTLTVTLEIILWISLRIPNFHNVFENWAKVLFYRLKSMVIGIWNLNFDTIAEHTL